jgi:hypothetical protein
VDGPVTLTAAASVLISGSSLTGPVQVQGVTTALVLSGSTAAGPIEHSGNGPRRRQSSLPATLSMARFVAPTTIRRDSTTGGRPIFMDR